MNEKRPYEIDTENIRKVGEPNAVRDILRGLVADTRGMLEGRAMRRRATDAKQKAIADEAYRQRIASLQERQIQLAEQRDARDADTHAAEKEARELQKTQAEEKQKLQDQAREEYETAFEDYHKAYTDWLKDPSPENEQMLQSATNRFQFYSKGMGIDSTYVGETQKTIQARGKELETEQTEKDLDALTDTFNDAFATFNGMTPADEGYADAHTKMLRAAGALNAAQEKLNIDDPLVENILKNPQNMGKSDKLGKLETSQAEVTQAFWDAYQNFTSDPEATLEDVEQRGADLVNLLTQLGEDPTTYTNILQNLRQQNTERIKAKREAEDAAKDRLDASDIEEIKRTIADATYLDDSERAFVNDALDSGIFQTKEDVNKHLSNLQTQKARAKYTGTDTSRSINTIENYEALGANREFIRALALPQQKNKKETIIAELDDIFDGKEFEELNEQQKDTAAMLFLQNDKAPGGDLVTRFMQATTFLQNGLANLYQEYNRLTKDGTQVKYKLGKLVKIREGIYRHVAGDISDPDVKSFDAKVGYLLTTYIRMVSGAQVTTYEEGNFKKMLVGAGNTVELNDAIFKALDSEIRAQLQGYFSRRTGNEWGEAIGDKVYHDAHDIAEDVANKQDSRIEESDPPTTDPEPITWEQATDETKIQSAVDGLRGGPDFEAMTPDELKNFFIEVGATEEEAEQLITEAQRRIAEEDAQ